MGHIKISIIWSYNVLKPLLYALVFEAVPLADS